MAPPLRVRILRAILRRVPRGRYRLLAAAPARGRFVSSLARDAGGAGFNCDLEDLISREACLTGLYEPPVTRVIQRHLRPGARVVDAGANWGYFTLLAAAAAGDTGRVLALEPDPRHFAALRANVALNGFRTVEALEAAAGANEGRATLHGFRERDANRGVSRMADAPAGGETSFEVRVAALDDLTRDGMVDLVKIDVEGAEADVLAGMQRGLAAHRYHAIVLELHPDLLRARGVDPTACMRTLERFGYRGWTIDMTPRAYRRAMDPTIDPDALLLSLERWSETPWPHLLWRC